MPASRQERRDRRPPRLSADPARQALPPRKRFLNRPRARTAARPETEGRRHDGSKRRSGRGSAAAQGAPSKLLLLARRAAPRSARGGAGCGSPASCPRLHGAKPAAQAAAAAPAARKPVFVDMPDIVANLNAPGRRASYIKLRSKLEVARAEDAPRRPGGDAAAAQDLFTTYLREIRPEELRGSAGTYRLREELMVRANLAAAPPGHRRAVHRDLSNELRGGRPRCRLGRDAGAEARPKRRRRRAARPRTRRRSTACSASTAAAEAGGGSGIAADRQRRAGRLRAPADAGDRVRPAGAHHDQLAAQLHQRQRRGLASTAWCRCASATT